VTDFGRQDRYRRTCPVPPTYQHRPRARSRATPARTAIRSPDSNARLGSRSSQEPGTGPTSALPAPRPPGGGSPQRAARVPSARGSPAIAKSLQSKLEIGDLGAGGRNRRPMSGQQTPICQRYSRARVRISAALRVRGKPADNPRVTPTELSRKTGPTDLAAKAGGRRHRLRPSARRIDPGLAPNRQAEEAAPGMFPPDPVLAPEARRGGPRQGRAYDGPKVDLRLSGVLPCSQVCAGKLQIAQEVSTMRRTRRV
jgi:hypothetical protein